jgi:hypothetical protein
VLDDYDRPPPQSPTIDQVLRDLTEHAGNEIADDGRHVDRQRLLDAPADQQALAAAVAVEAAMGNTLPRLVDDAGTTLALRPIPAHPSRRDIEQALNEPTAGGQWPIWTGRAWPTLPDHPPAERW